MNNLDAEVIKIQRWARKHLSRINTSFLLRRREQKRLIYRGVISNVLTSTKQEITENNYLCMVKYENNSKQIRWILKDFSSDRILSCFIKKEAH